MGKQPLRFELIDGKVFLIVEQLVWGEFVEVIREDVTDKVMPVVDDYLDHKLGLTDYKYKSGKVGYTGEKKYNN